MLRGTSSLVVLFFSLYFFFCSFSLLSFRGSFSQPAPGVSSIGFLSGKGVGRPLRGDLIWMNLLNHESQPGINSLRYSCLKIV